MFGLPPLARSLEAALRDAGSERPAVRLSAVRDLGALAPEDRSGRAVLALREALVSDAAPSVRAAAAVAFADSELKSGVEALLRAMDDPDPFVQQMVLLALGELGSVDHPRVRETVERALAGDVAPLRFQALIAAHRLGMDGVDATLLAATDDPDPEIRHLSLRLLEERATASAEADAAPRPNDAVQGAARARLADPALSVRVAAAILLGKAGGHEGDAVLAEVVSDARGVDVEDEQAAVVLAGELGIAAARRGLERRAFGGLLGRGRFGYESRIALARLGDSRARRAIARGLTAWSRDVRTLAVMAAGHAGLTEARSAIEAMQDDPRRAEPEAVAEALRLLRAAGA